MGHLGTIWDNLEQNNAKNDILIIFGTIKHQEENLLNIYYTKNLQN